eukprot:TRINITY_DN25141_c0_g2_i1.p1 TRINITY_DN25141_c0_g2~~TRINITY_DN25141_c0_g2_i1.p1  ORF type:complete len:442 (+),score=113.67 TRINITY_DN25141_c0_g2_i1:86-1327(+)
MQQVANVGIGSFRSGSVVDGLIRGALYTFGGVAATYYWAKDSESGFWTNIALPVIKRWDVDEETCLRQAIAWLARGRGPFDYTTPDPRLRTAVFGKELEHPLCLGAGFDRDAEALYGCFGLGFAGVEIGTVCPQKQAGNGSPRIFRINHDEAVIHRCGTPTRGMAIVSYFLEEYRKWEDRVGYPAQKHLVGVSIGRNKLTDEASFAVDAKIGVRVMSELSDYISVQLPHPPRPGERAFAGGKAWLDGIAQACIEQRAKLPEEARRPILLKVCADLTEQDRKDVAEVALSRKIDGLIVSNTTVSRPGPVEFHWLARQPGTMGGRPIKGMTTELLQDLYQRTGGKVTLVGSGGVSSAEDALEKIEAGASLIQLYSSLVTRGPGVVPTIKRDLALLLQEKGYADVSAAVGAKAGKA